MAGICSTRKAKAVTDLQRINEGDKGDKGGKEEIWGDKGWTGYTEENPL